jgi:hypothetical protein
MISAGNVARVELERGRCAENLLQQADKKEPEDKTIAEIAYVTGCFPVSFPYWQACEMQRP